MKKRVWDSVKWNHSVSRYSGSRYVKYDGDIRSGYAEFHYAEWRQFCKSIYYIT